MKWGSLCLSVCLLAALGECSIHGTSPPQFSSTYTVTGVLSIPYAELREPFQVWYDAVKGRSRIDYYDGMVNTYMLSGSGAFGTSLKVVPISTEEETNARSCFQVNGTKVSKVGPQSVLPDLTGFERIGIETINNLKCEKWRKSEAHGAKDNKYTMYIRWKTSETQKEATPIPVRYEMKGYNSLLGSHYDHYYLDYDLYDMGPPSERIFDIETNLTCTPFPGPGEDHIITFNPMKEFIENHEKHVDSAWEKFVNSSNTRYNKANEVHRRKEVFRQNLRYINSKNRANLGFKLAVNHLTDRTDLELRALRGRRHSPGYNGGLPFPTQGPSLENTKVPDELDWRLFGAVTPVKDQSVCGSCWSFGTTGAIEGAYFVKFGVLLRLSQQALVDCSWGFGNNGCDGGEDFRSYQWMMKHGGIPLESDYGGYLGNDGYCHADKVPLMAKITGYVNVTSGSETALKLAIFKNGPVSVAIDASVKSFSFYSNGVFYDPDCKNTPEGLDHAVLAVGYGKLNGVPYWLVKNSWSNYWGNDGYILMAIKDNNCGVMTSPTYVVM